MNSAAKLFCVKTYRGKVVAEPFPYLMVAVNVTLEPNI